MEWTITRNELLYPDSDSKHLLKIMTVDSFQLGVVNRSKRDENGFVWVSDKGDI